MFFASRVQRIVRVHHYGLRDKVNSRGTEVKYAKLELLEVCMTTMNLVKEKMQGWLE